MRSECCLNKERAGVNQRQRIISWCAWRFILALFYSFFFYWGIVERIYRGKDTVEKIRFLVIGYYIVLMCVIQVEHFCESTKKGKKLRLQY